MAGTKIGGKRTKETILKKYGEDYYSRIGAEGGKKGHTGGFAYDGRTRVEKLLGKRTVGSMRAEYFGRLGGRISKRPKKTV